MGKPWGKPYCGWLRKSVYHQLIDGKHSMIFFGVQPSGDAGFRWPIHNIVWMEYVNKNVSPNLLVKLQLAIIIMDVRYAMDGCEIMHQLVTIGYYETL